MRRHGILLVVRLLLKVYFEYFKRDLQQDANAFPRWEFEGNKVSQSLVKSAVDCVMQLGQPKMYIECWTEEK